MNPEDTRTWTQAFRDHVAWTSPSPIGLQVARAEGAYLITPNGDRYLDLLSGIGVANIGHTHPAVVAAVREQNDRHHHVMVYGEYIQETQALYAADLASVTPDGLDRVYFTNSGTEAIEGALKVARKVTGRPGYVSFDGAYHGDTLGSLSLAGNSTYRDPFEPLLGPVTRLSFNDEGALTAIDESVAGVVVEPIQGEGGIRIPQDAFLPALAARCREVGALLIFDEVMTGFGRTGSLFACEHWGVTPDLLVLAKALGGGYPLGAFVGRSEHLATLTHDPPLAHVTTFGGHPVSCAAGRAALGVLQAEGLVERSGRVGLKLLGMLRDRLTPLPVVREVRGKGLFLAIEFREGAQAAAFTDRCREARLLVGWTLHHDHIIRLAPPLITGEDTLEDAAGTMAEIAANL